MKFNDQTCLVSNNKLSKFGYIILQPTQSKDILIFQNGQEPESLHKKMKIINHFAKSLSSKYDNIS